MDIKFYVEFFFAYALFIPGAIMCLLPVKDHLRISGRKLSLLLFPFLILYSLLMPFVDYQFPTINHNIFFTLTVPFLFIGYCMAVKLEKIKLFYIIISTMAFFSFSGLGYFMADAYILNKQIKLPDYAPPLMIQWIIILVLICFIYLPFFYKRIAWTVEHFHTKSVWNIIWTVPALITFCNYMMIPTDYKNATAGRIFQIYLLIDFTLLLLFLLFQFMFHRIAKNLIEKSEQEQKTQLLEIQSVQYQSLLGYINETSRMRHDFRHTARTLLTLAQKNETEKMLSYLEQYNQELDACSPRLFCKHPSANAILAYYADIAQSQEIQIDWNIDLPGQINVSNVDLCSILGNLLENAIDGCATVPPSQRFINLSVDLMEQEELYIISVNSFNGVVKKSGQKYLSTKKNGNGIGLWSVSIAAEKYDGMTRFYHSETEFYSEVMLSL